MSEVYLNFAATSHPKPEQVMRRVSEALNSPPCDGRRGASGGGDPLQDCRRATARLVGARDPNRIALTPGATVALNYALQGCVLGLESTAGRARARRRRKPRVLTTVLEHNSVLRPLRHMQQAGRIDLEYLGTEVVTDPGRLEGGLRDGIDMLAITACSNVTGLIPDLALVTELCRQHGTILVLDAAQAAGSVAIDVSVLPPRSLVALAGHKGLLGPQGTGALYVGEGLSDDDVPPFMQGGTGVRSDSAGQPSDLPLRLEAGTPSIPGFAGPAAGVEFVRGRGVNDLGRHKASLTARLVEGMERCEGIRIFASPKADYRGGVVSFTLRGWDPREAAMVFEESFGFRLRGGCRCPSGRRQPSLREGRVMPPLTVRMVEDCFEDSSIREIHLDRRLDEQAVRRLGGLGSFEYFAEFPRPFFRIQCADGFYLKGVVGKASFRIFFTEPPGAGTMDAVICRISQALGDGDREAA